MRELENVIERAMILSPGDELVIQENLSKDNTPVNDTDAMPTLDENEREYIVKVLEQTNGKIFGDGGAGEILGIHPETLRSRMKKLGLKKKPG